DLLVGVAAGDQAASDVGEVAVVAEAVEYGSVEPVLVPKSSLAQPGQEYLERSPIHLQRPVGPDADVLPSDEPDDVIDVVEPRRDGHLLLGALSEEERDGADPNHPTRSRDRLHLRIIFGPVVAIERICRRM